MKGSRAEVLAAALSALRRLRDAGRCCGSGAEECVRLLMRVITIHPVVPKISAFLFPSSRIARSAFKAKKHKQGRGQREGLGVVVCPASVLSDKYST